MKCKPLHHDHCKPCEPCPPGPHCHPKIYGYIEVIDSLDSDRTDAALSANMGKYIKELIDLLDARVESLEDRADEIERILAIHQAILENHESRITSIEGRVTVIEEDIVNIKNDITSLKTRVTNIEGDITKIKSDITNIDNRLSTVETKVTNVQNQVNNLSNTVTNLGDRITNLNTYVNQQISNLGGEITNVTGVNATGSSSKLFLVGATSLISNANTNSNGSVYTQGGNVYGSEFYRSSDIRLKSEIKEADAINITQVPIVDYKKGDLYTTGVIAQEVKEVYPELTQEDEDTGILSVDSLGLVFKYIKNLQDRIKKLEEDGKDSIRELH